MVGEEQMLHQMKELMVELSTPSGPVFAGIAKSIDLHTDGGSVHITPNEDCYLNMVHATEISLRVGEDTFVFALENAAAGLREGRLTVIAENIRRIEPASP
jgi:F0F1-type ATP synthase epsilon subunit